MKETDVNVPDEYGNTPLQSVCFRGHFELFKVALNLLLSFCKRLAPFKIQALSKREDLNLIAEDSKDKSTAFSNACEYGHVQIAEYLLKIISERLGRDEMIKVLNKPDKYSQSSLLLAARKGHIQVVRFLLSFKETDVNMVEEAGKTCLHLASFDGHLEVVRVTLIP